MVDARIKRQDDGRIISLDAMRGIASLMVVVYHLPYIYGFKMQYAYLAVEFFFILSGWVMAYSYEERISNGLPFKNFALNRLARLYPLYLCATFFGFLVMLVKMRFGTPSANLACLLPNALLLPCINPIGSAFPLNGPAWSIFVEVAVNILWFAAVWLGLSTLRWKFALHLCFTVVLWGTAVYSHRYMGGFNPSDLHEGLYRGLLGFTGGVLLFSFRRQPWIIVYFAIVTMAVLLAFRLRGDSGGVTPLAFVVMGLLPALVWLTAWWRPAILENSVGAYLGDISYAVYLLHLPLAILLQKPLRLMLPGPGIASIALKSLIFSALLIALSTASFRCLEMPARRWLMRRFRKGDRQELPLPVR